MHKEEIYVCDACGRRFDTEQKALACEKTGRKISKMKKGQENLNDELWDLFSPSFEMPYDLIEKEGFELGEVLDEAAELGEFAPGCDVIWWPRNATRLDQVEKVHVEVGYIGSWISRNYVRKKRQ